MEAECAEVQRECWVSPQSVCSPVLTVSCCLSMCHLNTNTCVQNVKLGAKFHMQLILALRFGLSSNKGGETGS